MNTYLSENSEQIQGLRQLIFDTLDPLIDRDYCLLDIPDHKNIGDNLIWAGELAYLKRLPHKMTYSANLFLTQTSNIPADSIILLHGGGNFGDVWRVVQNFRNDIIARFKQNKIIVFPQTVQYDDIELLKQDVIIYDQHPDLTICTRDDRSFELLKKHFTKNRILLLPDMAFCLDYSKYSQSNSTNKILVLKRKDKELSKDFDESKIVVDKASATKKIEVKDWPTFNLTEAQEKREELLNKINHRLSMLLIRVPVLKSLVDHRHGLKSPDTMERYISQGIDFINEYDEIYTTRLHGFILGILLGKKVHIIDNYYGKNSGFYNTWLQKFKHAGLYKSN